MIHGVAEEENAEVETIDVVENGESAEEEKVVAIVEAIDVLGDDGTLVVVDSVEIAS